MKTDELVSLLSTGITPVDPHLSTRRLIQAIVLGGAASIVLMAITYGPRPDIGAMLHTPLFWGKLAFPASLAATAWYLVARLSRPGIKLGKACGAPAVPVLVVWAAAAVLLGLASPDARLALVMGQTWRTCPLNILLLSVPAFIAVCWAIRDLAPTRLRLTGAAAGMLASTIATVAYCFHCPEMSVAFWAVWYLLGILLASLVGALLGPRLLRW